MFDVTLASKQKLP